MALNLQVGTITQPGSTGNQTTSLPADFDPKALILWGVPRTSNGAASVTASFCMGMATARGGGAQAGYCTYFSNDGSDPTVVAYGIDDTAVLKLFSAGVTPTVDAQATFVSFGSGASSNFVLNWTNLHTTASIKINYLVLGGSDITDALVDLINLAAGATQDVTVATGFGQPDLLFFMGAGATSGTGGDSAASAAIGLSVAKSATERFAAVFNDEDNVGTVTAAAWAKQRAVIGIVPTTQAADCEAELSAKASWPTDGFQLTYSDQTAGTPPLIMLALKGTFSSKVGYIDSGTSAAAVDFDHTTTPKGALYFTAYGAGTAETINTTGVQVGSFAVGALDGTNDAYATAGNDDGAAAATTAVAHDATSAFGLLQCDNGGVDTAAGTISGTNARLTWDTAPNANTRIGVVSFGDSASTNATVSPPVATVSVAGLAPTPSLTIPTPLATIDVAALVPTPALTVPIPVGTISVQGLVPLIDTGGTNATVSPEPATVAVAALAPNPALTVEPPLGAINVAGLAPTPTLAVAPDPATVTVAAFAPTPAITLLPAQATVSVSGVAPTPAITVFPDQATVSTAALAPTPQITLLPDPATVSVAGLAPTPQITIQPGAATLLVAAFAPTLEGSAAFELGTVVCDDLTLAAIACDSLTLTADATGTLTLTAASSDALSLAASSNDSLSLTAV